MENVAAPGEVETPAPAKAVRRASRRRVGVRRVLGELLITAAVLILLFQGWKIWFNDIVFGASQTGAAVDLSESWALPDAGTGPIKNPKPDPGDPAVTKTPANAESFATIMIPSLGKDYRKIIAEGVGHDVLNTPRLGIGHYPSTQLPGELGNIVLASHRTAYGGAFHNIHELEVGDSVFLETKDGWYKYIFRSLEYVRANGVGVILPVPQQPGVEPTQRLITLTTCNPFLSSAERIIAYGVYDSWYPRDGGAPAEIAGLASAAGVR